MKRIVLALSAVAAFAAPALAADMAPRYTKAPPPPVAAVVNWTGCYVGGGGGYGLWNQENTQFFDGPPRVQSVATETVGGRGYFGTVQAGCDYQFPAMGTSFVVGAFGDYDFSSLKGKFTAFGSIGDEKMSSAWSVGGRVGWVALPGLLTYFSAGYTEATFDGVNFTDLLPPFGVPSGFYLGKKSYQGWFLGAGDEYALNFLPGLFWKTEYRFSEFDKSTSPLRDSVTNLPTGASYDSQKWVHTVRSELVYRFNWGSPVVARY